MATKAEEMKALNQIKKIVEGIGGADSYVGQAFSGCFEIAQENIENDFWNSMKDQRDAATKREYEASQKEQKLSDEVKKLNEEKDDWKSCAEKLRGNWREAKDMATENWNKFREQEDKVETLQQEIIRLKARLFDMMEAQGA